MRAAIVFALLVLPLTAGCSGVGLLGDGTSISVGSFREGLLRRGKRLPARGEGYRVPALWRERKNSYGTDELVRAIARAARRVAREHPGGTLGVADLSPRGGGGSVFHRSHASGRDADLIWYAVDARGRPVAPPDAMPRYDAASLESRAPRPSPHVRYRPFSPRRFDVARNWALVRALLDDPDLEIQYLFCHAGLKQRLLEHARARGEDPALVERAEVILHQPGDSLPHDDHLHVRAYCASDDRSYGCADRGPLRWWKKRYKYMPPTRRGEPGDLLVRLRGAPLWGPPRALP